MSSTKPVCGQFGRVGVKSFIDYKNSIGKPNKAKLLGKNGKKVKIEENEQTEVIINIGLMAWDDDVEEIREKRGRGKRMPIRVPSCSNYKTLLEKATLKWKDFHSNLYEEGKDYALLLEDGQEAQFLPGSNMKEFFSLNRYKEESLKDYKRIVLFLCTCEDLQQNASEPMEEEIVPPKHQKVVDMAVPGPSTLPGRAEALQIKNDQEIALAMQNEALNETEAHVNVNDNNNYYCDASTCDHEIMKSRMKPVSFRPYRRE
ncbi:hypothetical protein QZH41_017657 [Actinostola sp. cb2023]|nr:hypothetical protein QZH41_017657 [Actinostola sp. cb2023]